MDEALCIAYDLRHQVDILPDAFKHQKAVDHSATDMTLAERVQYLITELEARTRPEPSRPEPE